MIKKSILYLSVALSFIFGLAVGLFGRPTIYAKADVYTDELYLYQVDADAVAEYITTNGRYMSLTPRSSNVGYLIYSVEMEYPIIVYSKIASFTLDKNNYIKVIISDENDDIMSLDFGMYDIYIFCNSTKTNFNNQFSFSSNTGLGMAEFTENILVNVNTNTFNLSGFSFINNDNANIYNSGYEAGHTQGFADGYNEALNEGQNPLNSPFSFVYYFMNYEILPNFKMFYLFLIGIGAVLFRIIIKAGLI